MKQAMKDTELEQWFKLTKLTKEDVEEEKPKPEKTNRQEKVIERPVDQATDRVIPMSETTLVEVASNAGADTTSIVELDEEAVNEHKKRMSVKISNRRTSTQMEAPNNEPEPNTQTTITWVKQPVTFLGPKEETVNEKPNYKEKVENPEKKNFRMQEASTSKVFKKIVWDIEDNERDKPSTSRGGNRKEVKWGMFTNWLNNANKRENSSGVYGELPRLMGDERVGRPNSIFSFVNEDVRHKLKSTQQKVTGENRTAPTKDESEESFDDWKGWKGAGTETEEDQIQENVNEPMPENEPALENESDPYTNYMKNPTGNILGKRSKEIKKGIHKLNKMLQDNPEMNLHQSGFVPAETQSESEIGSHRSRDHEENRIETPRRNNAEMAGRGQQRQEIEGTNQLTGSIDQMIERVRRENEEAEEETEKWNKKN